MSIHRVLGHNLKLFIFIKNIVGPIWLDKGLKLIENLKFISKAYITKIAKLKYTRILTPQIVPDEVLHKSGHTDKYSENLFYCTEKAVLKPMSCPLHVLFFRESFPSDGKLPFRLMEDGMVTRNEASGAIDGLKRQYSFTQDDAHIFTNEENCFDEVSKLIDQIIYIYKLLNLKYSFNISTSYDKDSDPIWKWQVDLLKAVLESYNYEYTVSDDAAFYGPKIDIMINGDKSENTAVQVGTVQLDLEIARKFKVKVNDKYPIVIHRAIYGSYERMVAVLLEYFNGCLPYIINPNKFILTITPSANKVIEKEKGLQIAKIINSALLRSLFSKEDLDIFKDILMEYEYYDSNKILSARIKHIKSSFYSSFAIWGEYEFNNIKLGNFKELNISLLNGVEYEDISSRLDFTKEEKDMLLFLIS